MSEDNKKRNVIVVGGGISGLTAALNLQEQGYDVTVLEGGSRLGGKIQTTMLNNVPVDRGAEFIDKPEPGKPGSGNPLLIDLCKKLDVKLKPATDQDTSEYATTGGKMMSEQQFIQEFMPLQQRIAQDKAAIAANPNSPRAREIESMSLRDYLDSLNNEAASKGVFSLGKRNGYSAQMRDIVAGTFSAEEGRDPSRISAMQFVRESSSDAGSIFESNCGLRVDGGTERIIDALAARLRSNGVKIFTNAPVSAVSKVSDAYSLKLDDGTEVQSDKIVFALPTKALSRVSGLEDVGFSTQAVDTLKTAQYTKSVKFSVSTKIDTPDSNMNSSEGFEAWKTGPGVVTFLANVDNDNNARPEETVQRLLQSYAKAHGSSMDAMFNTDKIIFSGASNDKPCYCSPAVGQTAQLAALSHELDGLAEKGLGVVGTYIPRQANGAMGFMENGVESAGRMTNIMVEADRARSTPADSKWRIMATTQRNASTSVQTP